MYGFIRIIIVVIIFIICFLWIRKSTVANKKSCIPLLLVAMILSMTALYLIPIENLFVEFSSVESSFSYTNNEKIKIVVPGRETDLIIAQKGDKDTMLVIPKTKDGWKVGIGADIKKVKVKHFNTISVRVYEYKNSDEFYICAYDNDCNPMNISDNRNSKFFSTVKNIKNTDRKLYTYYTYVPSISADYIITLNGNPYNIMT